MLILGGIDPDSGISVQRSTLGGRRDVNAKRIPERFQVPLKQCGNERLHGRTASAKRLPIGRVQKALDGHWDDDRAAKNICDLPRGSVDR